VNGEKVKNESKDSLTVVVLKNDIEKSIKIFSKKFKDSNVMQELMKRRNYEKPSLKRKNKHDRAMRTRKNEQIF
jgi:ribosomal protein S21